MYILMKLFTCFFDRRFELNEIRNVERKTDPKRGDRYLIEVELLDVTSGNNVMLSEYVFMFNGEN